MKGKNKLIIAIAKLAARLHGAGLCHRDFYLCHLVMKKSELAGNWALMVRLGLLCPNHFRRRNHLLQAHRLRLILLLLPAMKKLYVSR